MKDRRSVVIYDEIATDVNPVEVQEGELWLTADDLTRATRFTVMPQGVCRDEMCFPVDNPGFMRADSGTTFFNLTAFAGLIKQPVARENNPEISAWYFGVRQDQRQELASLQAPYFNLPDIHGKFHDLYDFGGKKRLLVTWASW